MRHLTLGDLLLVLKDILHIHSAEVDLSVAGKVYRPLLLAKQAEIEAQPAPGTKGAVHAAELSEADSHHDAFGAAIFHLTQAVLLHPTLDPAIKDAAMRAQQTFVPALGVLTSRYADEAAHAHRKRADFESLGPDLKKVVAPGGESLYQWVAGFLEQGDRIGELLHGRAEAVATAEPPVDAGALRSSTIGLLGRFRQAIRDEVASGAALPEAYEARLFAFVDHLDQSRGEAKKRRVGAKPEGPESKPVAEQPAAEPPAGC